MKTLQCESLFLKVDVAGETVWVFRRPEELVERLEASGYDISGERNPSRIRAQSFLLGAYRQLQETVQDESKSSWPEVA